MESVPDKVTISFTESPEPRASSIKVVNSNNERIDKDDLQVFDLQKGRWKRSTPNKRQLKL
jgi:methionine-rich copper-binding protein CopC